MVKETFARQLKKVIDTDFSKRVSNFERECKKCGKAGKNIGSSLRKYLKGEANPTLEKLLCIIEASGRDFSFFVQPDAQKVAPYYQSRSEINMRRYFRMAERKIDVLTTRLNDLVAKRDPISYLAEIENRLDENHRLMVRILVLSPQSDYAARRGIQIRADQSIRAFRAEMTKALDIVRETASVYRPRFEARIYDQMNTTIMHRIDRDLFLSHIPRGRTSHESGTVQLKTFWSGVTETYLEDHFEQIWNDDANKNALVNIPQEIQEKAQARRAERGQI